MSLGKNCYKGKSIAEVRARWMGDWLMNAVLNSFMQRRKKPSNYHLSASNLQEIHARMHQNASRAKKLRKAKQWQLRLFFLHHHVI